jgi:hypothetical protein
MARKKTDQSQPLNHTESDGPKKELTPKQVAFLEALVKRKGNVTAAAKVAEISRGQVYEWRNTNPTFEAEYQLTRTKLEEFLFEKVVEFAELGDITACIFALKSLNRARFDDAYARQERALEKGLQPAEGFVPVRAVLVRDPEPPGVKAPVVNGVSEQEH